MQCQGLKCLGAMLSQMLLMISIISVGCCSYVTMAFFSFFLPCRPNKVEVIVFFDAICCKVKELTQTCWPSLQSGAVETRDEAKSSKPGFGSLGLGMEDGFENSSTPDTPPDLPRRDACWNFSPSPFADKQQRPFQKASVSHGSTLSHCKFITSMAL